MRATQRNLMSESGSDNNPPSYANAVMQGMREPLLVLDGGLCVKAATRSFYDTFKTRPEQTLGRALHELGNGQWNIPALGKLLDEALTTSGEFDDYEVEHDFPEIGRRTMLLNARRMRDGDKKTKLILLGIENVTKRRAAEHKLEASEIRYRRLFEAAHDGILILNTVTRKITDVNPFMMELLDYPRAHFIGKELWEIGIFRDKEANQSAMLDLQKNGSIRFENLPLQDRTVIVIRLKSSPMFIRRTTSRSSSAIFATSASGCSSSGSGRRCWPTSRHRGWKRKRPIVRRIYFSPPSVTRCGRR